MSRIDNQGSFSDAQAVTATALSTNVVDLTLAAPQYAAGQDLFVVAKVNTTFAGGTNMTTKLWTDNTATVSSGADIITGDLLTVANNQLDAGELLLRVNLKGLVLQQYIGLQFVVVGTMSAGKIDAFLEVTPESTTPNIS